jgi:hypothetical protein
MNATVMAATINAGVRRVFLQSKQYQPRACHETNEYANALFN